MDDARREIGERIRSLRKQKKLTLAQVADLCKCSPSLISQIEMGRVNSSISTLKTISDALGTSLAWLVSEDSAVCDTSVSLMDAKERKILITEGSLVSTAVTQF